MMVSLTIIVIQMDTMKMESNSTGEIMDIGMTAEFFSSIHLFAYIEQ